MKKLSWVLNGGISFYTSVRLSDIATFEQFSEKAGIGFTSLPKNRKLLEERIHFSEASFRKKGDLLNHESYFFVLQLGEKIFGSSGLISRVGISEPFYAYHLLSVHQSYPLMKIDRTVPILHFVDAQKKPTELCALFLLPEQRGKAFGQLLSLSRLLFIRSFRNRFARVVIAEMRGYYDEMGHSPFWEAIGRPFFGLNFDEANFLRISHPDCIDALFPKHPIYTPLLPIDAQKVIGKMHPQTIPAWKMLEKQGFSLSNYYDLFDGGPHVYAHTDQIEVIKSCQKGVIKKIEDQLEQGIDGMLSNGRLDFRACFGKILEDDRKELSISSRTANALQVEKGDEIHFWVNHKS